MLRKGSMTNEKASYLRVAHSKGVTNNHNDQEHANFLVSLSFLLVPSPLQFFFPFLIHAGARVILSLEGAEKSSPSSFLFLLFLLEN